MDSDRLIPLGVITAPHGIKGEVRIRSFTADPSDITAYGPLRDPNGTQYGVTVKSYAKDVLIASVVGVNSREAAEKLRNIELCVPRSALPQGEDHEYYHEDLTGLALLTEDGEAYGTLLAVHNFGAGDLVTVRRASGEEEFIPFTRAAFPTIDLQKRTGVIIPPAIVTDKKL